MGKEGAGGQYGEVITNIALFVTHGVGLILQHPPKYILGNVASELSGSSLRGAGGKADNARCNAPI